MEISEHGRRYVNHNDFIDLCKKLELQDVRQNILQFLERKKFLFPVKRIIFDAEYAKYMFAVHRDPDNPFNGKNQFEIPSKWITQYQLERRIKNWSTLWPQEFFHVLEKNPKCYVDCRYTSREDSMALFKNAFRIESTRLKEYDYSRPGGYFVTICVHNHRRLFGDVQEEEMILSPVGKIARRCWEETPEHFDNITLDEFVIMPNHMHGIIMINDGDECDKNTERRDVQLNVSTDISPTKLNVSTSISSKLNRIKAISPKRGTLSVVVRTYKAAVTTMCRRNGYDNFKWQSRFYEHIIRDDEDLQDIRDCIINNPIKWFSDKENCE